MSYTVYLHLFPNEKTYVGITCQKVERRWRNGKGYEGQLVYDAIKKYGWDNIKHIILENGLSKEQAEEKEKYYIKKYDSLSHRNGYNIESGGYVCGSLSDETKAKISESKKGTMKGEKHWHYGKHWGDDVKNKISESHKGMKYGKGTLEKKREMFSGKKNPMYGVKLTAERKSKLQKACVDATSKAVICIETGIEYKSSAEAQRQTGINSRTICYVCNKKGYYKTAGGYHWKYREELK